MSKTQYNPVTPAIAKQLADIVGEPTAGTNGKTTFYFDEAVSTQVNGAPRTPVCFPDGARIGNWWGSRQLRGRISDFRIYGAALNAGEILAVSGAGSVTRWTGPLLLLATSEPSYSKPS